MELVKVDNAKNIIDKLYDRFWDIPFENSGFQTQNFILNSSITKERAYRNAALRLSDRLGALQEAHLNSLRNDIKKKQLQIAIKNETDELKVQLLEIDILEIDMYSKKSKKLINDAIVEANQLYNFIQSCPEFSREEFENSEREYFEKKLRLDINGITGAIGSLYDMGVDLGSLGSDKLTYREKENDLLTR